MQELRAEEPRVRERGSITAFAVVIALALLVCAGLVVDGGAKIQAHREAHATAEEAARAGAGQIDVRRAYADGRVEVDGATALSAARAYLSSGGHSGRVTLSGGQAVQVTVTVSRPTRLLSLIGIASVTTTASATARMFHGIERIEQGIDQGRP
ncbi:pilus assembly protein TadG-related protein [Spongiactinospora sp. TRM90649]|uniref:pilus assembly protein TadG-related protein n=1 Tax=Spongiactinospora sp. TRM90649 TaxID=3031114 RepID=UPI0023F71151|nr:pilus assembly protein TadG-related protein [Spongiactinospora sp. TRM90649]MDF5759053.1 pilus assembly protein TadG-related protein [Spongiactinospora sp. TRM90649]